MNPLLAIQATQAASTGREPERFEPLSDAERDSVLELGNGGPSIESLPGSLHSCLYDLVTAQAERSPEALAVIGPPREITYRQLVRRANGLGQQLSELGVGPEIRVAILADRSIESLIGVLGILASGGAYVPLDPSYPDERIAFVLDNASVQVMLVPAAFVERAGSAVRRAAMASKVVIIAAAPISEHRPHSAVAPENAAYVIYTSGSTGTPKGVVVSHRSAVNLAQGFIARHDFAGHRLLMIPPLIFDASVGDVFPALSVGATIVLHPTPAELGSVELQQFCHEFKITAIDAPAALWRRWTEGFANKAENSELLPDLTLMMFGGESVSLEQARRFARLTGNRVVLANHYGPTEASVCATMLITRDGSEFGGAELPIGRPLPGVRVYVLDQELRLVPQGVEGELCIGGVGVARGYLGLPELTAERFIRDPFQPDAEARMYRTGDLVRWNADGTLQFIGRFDQQVKIRGLRVELGEIEARLAEHPSVQEAVVLAREDEPSDKRLVAYVTARGAAENGSGREIDIEALRAHLSSLLPENMVPAAYVVLERLPLTANGKLDRKALPAPDGAAYVTRGYEVPVGEVECTIARIWAEVLQLERVGRNDNFFELGGHSLLAMTVIERMREAGLAVEVRAVFAAPTLKGLAEAVGGESGAVEVPPNLIPAGSETITPEMLTLVKLKQSEIDRIVASVPGGAADVQDIYSLTSLQEGFLFHHLLEKEGDVYLAPTLFSIDSHEHLNRYVEALQMIIDRHDILRTAVVWEGLPEPVQVVWRHAPLRVEEVKLDAAAGDITEQLCARFDPRHYRVDVRRPPLWRLFITKDAPNNRWVILELMHHLIGDHVTLQVMQQEIQMIVQGRAAHLPKPLPFRNFVAQARLGVSREDHEAFFTRMLGDVDEPTAPFGLTDVLGDGSEIVETRYELDAELCQRLRAQARALGVGTASVCHLAWALVLARTSGRDDVVFGTVMLGRMQSGEGAERVMGIFINTLPVRIKIKDEGVRASVRQTHELLTQLLRHEHAPLLLAQRCSKVRAPAPLFTALLNYRYVGNGEAILVRDAVDLQDGDMNKTHSSMKLLQGWERTNYPLGLYVNDLGQGFSVDAQVHESIDPQRVCRLMEKALESLVDALENEPQKAVGRLQILPEEERQQVLYGWNATQKEYPQNTCIHELFEDQVKRTPSAAALVFEEKSLSYVQLNQRANQLAHYLREKGVKPDERVGICMDRGIEMVVALLGALKAGGAYVPLDPEYPDERLQFMMKDSRPMVVLTQGHLQERLTAISKLSGEKLPVIDLTAAILPWERQAAKNAERDEIGLAPEHLAYVIYTSGSTGTPKGVMVEHRSVVNRLFWMQDAYELEKEDAVLQKTPFSFDVSVWEFFWPLLTGAQLVMARSGGHKDPTYLSEAIERNHITTIHFVPSMLQAFLEHGEGSRCSSLRRIVCSGEALPGAVARRCQEVLPWARLHNLYGPTEAAVDVTSWSYPEEAEKVTTVPIGRPIANTQMYILDAQMEPVPVGVVGEIYIGGVQVARGYLNRNELTAERFVRDPFAAQQPARMYRTGDLGRWLEDGNIEYLGRNDFQVKIRGFRIELGEIEARLLEYPGVREAVVMARQGRPGEQQLVAYYTTVEQTELSAEELRKYLTGKLPEYMVPAAYVVLEKLPLSANGKLDRKALPTPDEGAFVRRGYEAPEGEVEITIARIWAEALKLERVGRNENFFELGGHSLLAMTVIERMREAAMPVEVRALFDAPTLKGLAAAVGGGIRGIEVPPNLIPEGCTAITPEMLPLVRLSQGEIDRIVASVPGGAANVQDIYPLTPMQEGFLFHHLLEKEGDVYLMTKLLGGSRERLEHYAEALRTVIQRHDILRTAVAWEGLREPVQVVWRQAPLRVEEVKLDAAGGEIAEQLRFRFDPRRYRLDVRQAPMWRLFLAEDAPNQRWVMLELTHHLVDDNTTERFLLGEIEAIMAGEAESLGPPLPFRNFVAQARLGVSREEHEAFFTRMLGDVGEPIAPFGLTDVQGDGSQIVETRHKLDAELCHRLRAQARTLSVSLASLCHLAWALVLARTSGRDDVVFGTVMFGRMQGGEGMDRAMGIFINTLPVRIKVGDEGVRASLRQTHELLIQLLRHEHAPLALAQRCSKVRAPAPLFTSLLNYRHIRAEFLSSDKGIKATETWAGMELLGDQERTNYPFNLFVNDLGEELSLDAQVDSSIDPRRVCGLMEKALESLVTALEENPEAAVCGLDVLPTRERRQLLVEWNDRGMEYEKDRCIHGLFEAQARQMPEAIAVTYEGQSLTYGELNRRANRLAHYLRGMGVKPDERVALCAERSLEMVVAIVGILKAGGAYVPLDPAYPGERLEYMLEDSGPVALLVHLSEAVRSDLNAVLTHGSIPVVDLEKDVDVWSSGAEADLNPEKIGLKPEHLAYVIYTSGSTGKPKGVMVEHTNIVRLLSATQDWFHFDHNDVWTLFHSYAFDFSVWEIWGALAYGGKLVVVSQLMTRSPQEFYGLLCGEGVTVLNQTPTAFRQLIAAQGGGGASHRLRFVIFGGEALEVSTLRPWYEREVNRATHLINMYGITETTVHVTYRSLEKVDSTRPGASPIGRRIPDLTIYILDSRQQPVPIGVAGELYVGGAGVARGYLNRAELTAERFLKDPFSIDPRARMYRTGDVGRFREDGNLEYLGRNDHQVKIRGFRIELGEIEARLAEHPSVGEATVLARKDQAGDKRLVAYYTGAENFAEEIGAEVLRGYLGAKLPEYMVPAAYVRLEKFPLTANGKLDRKALPAPERESYVGEAYEEPVGEVETTLAEIWEDALKAERVGRHDNFFALGGDSIRVISVIARMREHGWACTPQEIFKHQTIASLARAITPISNSKPTQSPELLNSLISDPDRSLLPEDIEDAYSLSLLQMGMIFHNQLTPRKGTYHDVFSFHLRIQNWDLETFQIVLDALAQKHPILRTSIALDGFSEPLQLVHRRATIPVTVFDIRSLDSATQEKMIAEWLEQEKETTLDLKRAPLVRVFIHLRGDDTLQQTLSFHHAILDGWSVASFQTELLTEYARLRATHEKTLLLKPLATAFKTMVALEKQAIGSEQMRSFWRSYLAGHAGSSLSVLQADGSIEPDSTCELTIPTRLKDELTELANRLRVPIRTVLLTAYVRVMSMLVGNTDVVTGVLSHGRPQEQDGDRILGLFLNTLPFRVNLVSGSWEDLILNVFETEMRVSPFQSYPYFQLFLENGRTPLVEAVFNYVNFYVYDGLRDLGTVEMLGVRTLEATNFPLMINVIHQGEKLWLGLRFDSERLSRNQAERIGTNYLSVLQALAKEPKTAHQLFDCLSAEERQQVLGEWNATRTDYPQDKCIHELFEEQVNRTPQAIAAISDGEELSYDELNARANQLARHLRTLGVEPDRLVAICMERGLNLLIALLGVLKAGGAYVPMDPSNPPQRLRDIFADAEPRVLLTQRHLRELLPQSSVSVISLDEDWDRIAEHSSDNLAAETIGLKPSNLAYVIFTSGSTGRPKGVMIEHRSVVNFLSSMREQPGITKDDRLLAVTTVSFDIAALELFLPLIVGAEVVVASRDTAADGQLLSEVIKRRDVTVLQATPATWRLLLEDESWRSPHLRALCGGEALPTSLASQVLGRVQALWNLYGPTETTIWSCIQAVTGSSEGSGPSESIGRPIANTCTYILDASFRPVPVGIPGEIYIGGAGGARGYLGNPGLTAERFIPDPFSSEPGSRMYRTGDLGRWYADGTIEYLGRNDFQVKIRGFRIELGEIEARLAEHPSVREAVVVAREDHPGEKRLVAYVTAAESSEERAADATIDVEALRAHLSSLLPEYMVPAAYVLLPKLPLTPNGKLDRKALPSPDPGAYLRREYEVPVGEMETTVARVWADVLKLDRIGRHDNFFETGGHSLLVVKVTSLLRQRGIEATVADVFNRPTIESFAAALDKGSVDAPHRGAQRIREGTQTPLFLVHDAYGDELYFSALAQYLPKDLPVYGLPSIPPDEPRLHTMRAMAERMVNLLQQVQAAGPYRLAGWSFGGVLAYEIAQQLLARGHAVEFLGLMDAVCPGVNGFGTHQEKTPEAVLVELCEEQRVERSSGRSVTPAFDVRDANLDFDELYNRYRELKALPQNFEHLSSHEARAQCRNLDIYSRAMEAYRPHSINIPLHLFVANERPASWPLFAASLGWESCIPAHLLYAQTVPGSHQSMMTPPHIKILGQRLSQSLAAAATIPDSFHVIQARAGD